MGRWEPDARGRLAQAALELFAERGYDRTTTADIAAAAGLTERTFFRHFADKREALFDGSAELQRSMVAAVAAAPSPAGPMDAVAAALQGAAALLQERAERAPVRAAVVAAHPELVERELIKMATLAVALATALRDRGVAEPAARLAAEAGIAVFRVSFDRWVLDPAARPMGEVAAEALAELRAVTAG